MLAGILCTLRTRLTADLHDGEAQKRRDHAIREAFKERNERLREDIVNAYNQTFGIALPEETGLVEVVAAVEEHRAQIDYAEVERRVLEKFLVEYRNFEQTQRAYDRRILEDEWDTDAMLVMAHLLQ